MKADLPRPDPAARAAVSSLFDRAPPVLVEVRFPHTATAPDWFLYAAEEQFNGLLQRLHAGAEVYLSSVWDLKKTSGPLRLKIQDLHGNYCQMDKVARYRQIIRDLIQHYAQFKPAVGDVQIDVIFNDTNDHYELMYAGWNRTYRIHGPVLHIDIRDGKVWIQHDGIEDGVAEVLVEKGIPAADIVLAFKPPEVRQYTGFAVA